jgi:hypothetical protein
MKSLTINAALFPDCSTSAAETPDLLKKEPKYALNMSHKRRKS